MAVTVITKKRGRPLVTGLVGVSIISCKGEEQLEREGCRLGEGKEGTKEELGEGFRERQGCKSSFGYSLQNQKTFIPWRHSYDPTHFISEF